MVVSTPAIRSTLVMMVLVGQAAAQSVPVLTVCEALQNLKLYNGKSVVIVGRSGYTLEGTFMGEDCGPDGRVMIQGNRWLSLIYVSAEDPKKTMDFHFDQALVRMKLAELKRTMPPRSESKSSNNPFAAHWTAMFGRLVSPKTLRSPRPPSASQPKNLPGNGFGANGSVPAKLAVLATQYLTSEE